MNRKKWAIMAIGLVALLGIWTVVYAHPVADNDGWYCPLTGQRVTVPQPGEGDWDCPGYYGRRHGMMGGHMMGGPMMGGPMMGGGMMAYGRGYGHHRGYANCPYGYGYEAEGRNQPLSEDQAKSLLTNYVNSTGNPNLKLGNMTDKDDVYEAQIVTQDDSLVDTIQVSKKTGLIRFVR